MRRAQAVPVYAETLADALARNVKQLATSPKNFNALIGAGRAALQMGDAQSAAGFFARAEEVYPNRARCRRWGWARRWSPAATPARR